MDHNIEISAAACEYIKKCLAKENKLAFRLTVKKTGCSGYSYEPILTNNFVTTDVIVETNGLKIFIDIVWVDLLKDIKIDYVEDTKNGIKQKKLIFINEKENSRCGCGESFQI